MPSNLWSNVYINYLFEGIYPENFWIRRSHTQTISSMDAAGWIIDSGRVFCKLRMWYKIENVFLIIKNVQDVMHFVQINWLRQKERKQAAVIGGVAVHVSGAEIKRLIT